PPSGPNARDDARGSSASCSNLIVPCSSNEAAGVTLARSGPVAPAVNTCLFSLLESTSNRKLHTAQVDLGRRARSNEVQKRAGRLLRIEMKKGEVDES